MKEFKRYLSEKIREDLAKKMVFLAGPRQVGKTTLSFGLLKNGSENHPAYINWDYTSDKTSLLAGNLPAEQKLIILDEIHKYKNWRNLVKGFYDKNKSKINFLITGSARLDYYSHGGDSLQGRYFFFRLHPFSLAEVDSNLSRKTTERLLKFGGFPEPYSEEDETFWKRWQNNRMRRVFSEDILGLEQVREIEHLKLLAEILPDRIGSPLSVKSLREDLNVAHETAESWLTILENLYVAYRIAPYGTKKIRSVKKEKKLYLWDWSLVKSPGARFENMVANHLLKYCHLLEDTQGEKMELSFMRDYDKREVDFVVLKNGTPLFAVECKLSEKEISPHIKYFNTKTKIPKFYQVHLGSADYENSDANTRVLPFEKLVEILKLP